ncbi:outer membrane beta-barrel protein [Rhodomicrobium sp. Az07]|uniref:outer membrane protein n=1 Tax=Rhodomicrobium sp. Az07 TaxID=2839034 RepID=UPI001BE8514B|nr:outer membrane beta-barrel protein [Rhodomicrobium sp. Az07]MBT3071454.1 outer membrane beta-barrel protein [Rhodomicrobium sp. Az07]
MSVVKSVGGAAVGLVFAAQVAYAADPYYGGGYGGGYRGYKDPYVLQPVAPIPLWRGFYIGGNIGGAWSTIDTASNVVFVNGVTTVLSDRSFEGSGFLGGLQLGYNIPIGNFLWGIEGDIGGLGNDASRSFAISTLPPSVLSVSSDGGWYGDVTLRGGFLYGAALIYLKGGFGFYTGETNVTLVTDGISALRQSSGTFTGWTLGGGLEYRVGPRWSIKAEYLYFDFGDSTFNSDDAHFNNDMSVSTFKIGFNVFLNGVGPLY